MCGSLLRPGDEHGRNDADLTVGGAFGRAALFGDGTASILAGWLPHLR